MSKHCDNPTCICRDNEDNSLHSLKYKDIIFGYLFGFTRLQSYKLKEKHMVKKRSASKWTDYFWSKELQTVLMTRRSILRGAKEKNKQIVKLLEPIYVSTPYYQITLHKGYIGLVKEKVKTIKTEKIIVDFDHALNLCKFPYPVPIGLNLTDEGKRWKTVNNKIVV